MFQKYRGSVASVGVALLLSIYTINASAAFAQLEEWRCKQQDGAPMSSLDVVSRRLAWAEKCYPDLIEAFGWSMDPNKNVYKFSSGVVPVYPVFGYVNPDTSIVVIAAPTDVAEACDSLQKQAPSQRIKIVGFCGVGCLTGDQVVLFGSGPMEIGSLEARQEKQVITLSEGANLKAMKFQPTPLRQIVTDLEPTLQNVVKITTAANHSVVVTLNHPLVDGQGLVRRAEELKVGDSLTRADGAIEVISAIQGTSFVGNVFNVRVESQKIEENIYVSQGFLSGSIAIQNDEVSYMNRKLLRNGDLFSAN